MAAIKLNARDMIIELSDGGTTPVWTQVAGLNTFTYNPSENEETVDVTTFSDGGNYTQEKMQKGAMVEVEGFYIASDLTPFAQDAGQLAIEVWHELLGPASVRTLRFRHVSALTWKVWKATCTLGEQGGGNNDKASFKASFTRCGASASAAVV